jgi:hypothetical protein
MVAERHPGAAVINPPRSTVASELRQRSVIAKYGRIGWQRSLGYSRPSLTAAKPSSVDFTFGFCPLSEPRQKSVSMSSTGRRTSAWSAPTRPNGRFWSLRRGSPRKSTRASVDAFVVAHRVVDVDRNEGVDRRNDDPYVDLLGVLGKYFHINCLS